MIGHRNPPRPQDPSHRPTRVPASRYDRRGSGSQIQFQPPIGRVGDVRPYRWSQSTLRFTGPPADQDGVTEGGALRAEDIFYAATLAILMAWLVFSTGATAPHGSSTPVVSLAPRVIPAADSFPGPLPVVAEVTLDSERFYIPVGDDPPSFGVAVGANDQPSLDPSRR